MPIHHQLLGKLPVETERIRNYLADEDLGARHCSAHENVLKPGAEVPGHLHGVEEVIVCLEGEGECTFGDEPPARYRAGSVVIIPPQTPHVLRNVGSTLLRQICFFAGNPTHTQWIGREGSVRDVGGQAAG
jgi:quercetin dioxygenase-like cupin family protein